VGEGRLHAYRYEYARGGEALVSKLGITGVHVQSKSASVCALNVWGTQVRGQTTVNVTVASLENRYTS
jgi:hypothetical protein